MTESGTHAATDGGDGRSPQAVDLARALRRHWGARARFHRYTKSGGTASVIVYDACRIAVTAEPGGIHVVTASVPVADVPVLDETVPAEALSEIFDRIDALCRAALPPAFLARFDAGAAAGGGSTGTHAGSTPRQPGPVVTGSDLDAAISAMWGAEAERVPDQQASAGELRRTVRLHGRVDVVIVRGEPHHELTGGVRLGDEVEVADFDDWFTADHPDEQGLLTLLRRLSAWVDLRLGRPAAKD